MMPVLAFECRGYSNAEFGRVRDGVAPEGASRGAEWQGAGAGVEALMFVESKGKDPAGSPHPVDALGRSPLVGWDLHGQ